MFKDYKYSVISITHITYFFRFLLLSTSNVRMSEGTFCRVEVHMLFTFAYFRIITYIICYLPLHILESTMRALTLTILSLWCVMALVAAQGFYPNTLSYDTTDSSESEGGLDLNCKFFSPVALRKHTHGPETISSSFITDVKMFFFS